MNHLEEDLLLRYVRDEVPAQQQLEVDSHLADCERCRRRVRSLLCLRENFEELWSAWSAEEHARSARCAAVAAALAHAAQFKPSLRQKGARWLSTIAESIHVGVRALLQRQIMGAMLGPAFLPEKYSWTLHPVAAGVGSPEQAGEVEQRRRTSSTLLSDNRLEAARKALAEAGDVDRRAVQGATLRIESKGFTVLQARADGARAYIAVQVWPSQWGREPEAAVLLSAEDPELTRIAEFEALPGETYRLAEFQEVPEGAFELLVLPPPLQE